MRRRIYFLVPDVATTQAIVEDLLLARVDEPHLHVVARQDVPLQDLPPARLAQSSDLVPALERGAAAGGIAGVLAGLLALSFPPAGLTLGGGALLGLTAFGAGFGAWMAGMVGAGLPNSHIARYQSAVEAGQLLLMVDVPRGRVDAIEALVTRHHPGTELEGIDPDIPVFP